MFAFLLLLQQAPAPHDSALRTELERAVVQNAIAAVQARPFSARYQASIAVLKRLPENIEGSSAIDQVAGVYRWTRAGVFDQHETGRRSRNTGLPLPLSGFLGNGWIVPPVVGEAFCPLVPSRAVLTLKLLDSLEAPSCDGPLNPLSVLRDSLYQFRGGDTVRLKTPDGVEQLLIRVDVTPRAAFPERVAVFRGDIYLDPASGRLRRMRGQVLSIGGPAPHGAGRVLSAAFSSALLLDLGMEEIEGVGTVPTYQWLEYQLRQPFSTEIYTVIRTITRLSAISPTTAPDGGPLLPQLYGLTEAPRDSIHHFRGWTSLPGRDIEHVQSRELADVGPPRARPTGPPTLTPRASGGFDYFRYNRVEGVYLGAVATLRLRDAAPGWSLKGGVGYATKADIVRPQLVATWQRDHWFITARGERALDLATKFADPLDYGRGIKPLFALDNFDYVDRWNGALGIGRYLRRHRAGLVRVDIGYASDQSTPALFSRGLLGQHFLPNPNVEPGRYLRTVVRLDVSPDISARFTRPGLALRIRYENGSGDLDYNRYQAGVSAQANVGRVVLTFVGDGGIATGAHLPSQQLFLLGGQASLPGYDYDQFAGDRAWLARGLISIPIPVLDRPLRVGGGLKLPPPAPSISFRLYTGQAQVTSGAMQASVDRLGIRPDPDGPGALPYARASDGVRASTEVRLSLFGNLFGFGVAKALESGTRWRFQFSLGQSF